VWQLWQVCQVCQVRACGPVRRGVAVVWFPDLEGVTRSRWSRGAGTKYHSFGHRVEVYN
jgi:hypothetical protein